MKRFFGTVGNPPSHLDPRTRSFVYVLFVTCHFRSTTSKNNTIAVVTVPVRVVVEIVSSIRLFLAPLRITTATLSMPQFNSKFEMEQAGAHPRAMDDLNRCV